MERREGYYWVKDSFDGWNIAYWEEKYGWNSHIWKEEANVPDRDLSEIGPYIEPPQAFTPLSLPADTTGRTGKADAPTASGPR